MTDAPKEKEKQQKTLSVRISDALHDRLERAREMLSMRTGTNVTTSEVAKQFLESGREDRLEVVELLSEPTDTLLKIRRKGEAKLPLSQPEWTALAYFVQQGSEAFSSKTPNRISCESQIGILEAFLAVYDLRTVSNSTWEKYYLGNLPSDFDPKWNHVLPPEEDESKRVRITVSGTIHDLKTNPKTKWSPILAARDLYIVLEEEPLQGAETLNAALYPYWPILWRVAARGHYFLKGKPIREESRAWGESVYRAPIPSVREGDFQLSFARNEGNDISLLLSLPGPRGPMYPISQYPKISEFRSMLAKYDPETQFDAWDGEYFFGYLVERGDKFEFWFRAYENGITFGFTESEWQSIQKLFARAWEEPEVARTWEALSLEYGEL